MNGLTVTGIEDSVTPMPANETATTTTVTETRPKKKHRSSSSSLLDSPKRPKKTTPPPPPPPPTSPIRQTKIPYLTYETQQPNNLRDYQQLQICPAELLDSQSNENNNDDDDDNDDKTEKQKMYAVPNGGNALSGKLQSYYNQSAAEVLNIMAESSIAIDTASIVRRSSSVSSSASSSSSSSSSSTWSSSLSDDEENKVATTTAAAAAATTTTTTTTAVMDKKTKKRKKEVTKKKKNPVTAPPTATRKRYVKRFNVSSRKRVNIFPNEPVDLYAVKLTDIDPRASVYENTLRLICTRFEVDSPLRRIAEFLLKHNYNTEGCQLTQSELRYLGMERDLTHMFQRSHSFFTNQQIYFTMRTAEGGQHFEETLLFDFKNIMDIFRLILPKHFARFLYFQANVGYMHHYAVVQNQQSIASNVIDVGHYYHDRVESNNVKI